MVPAAEGADSLWDATGESKKDAAGKGWQARAGRSVCVARLLGHVIPEYRGRIRCLCLCKDNATGPCGQAGTCLRKYNHVVHTWEDPVFFDDAWAAHAKTSEASICR